LLAFSVLDELVDFREECLRALDALEAELVPADVASSGLPDGGASAFAIVAPVGVSLGAADFAIVRLFHEIMVFVAAREAAIEVLAIGTKEEPIELAGFEFVSAIASAENGAGREHGWNQMGILFSHEVAAFEIFASGSIGVFFLRVELLAREADGLGGAALAPSLVRAGDFVVVPEAVGASAGPEARGAEAFFEERFKKIEAAFLAFLNSVH